ncbi:MAG: type II toxin-antitoxin system Phd/YefM family antitoxin [Acidobacteriota bacterium]
MKHQQVSATDFKAKCLALLDEVNETGGSVTITKRGKPVAILQPAPQKARKTTRGMFAGQIEILGDIVNFNMGDAWEMVRERNAAEAQTARRKPRKAS